VVDIVNQFLLHVVCTIFVHGLLDCIAKLLLRLQGVDRAITTLEIYTLVLVKAVCVGADVFIAVARIVTEKIPSCSDHFWSNCFSICYWKACDLKYVDLKETNAVEQTTLTLKNTKRERRLNSVFRSSTYHSASNRIITGEYQAFAHSSWLSLHEVWQILMGGCWLMADDITGGLAPRGCRARVLAWVSRRTIDLAAAYLDSLGHIQQALPLYFSRCIVLRDLWQHLNISS
jgi:hypothetical protein